MQRGKDGADFGEGHTTLGRRETVWGTTAGLVEGP